MISAALAAALTLQMPLPMSAIRAEEIVQWISQNSMEASADYQSGNEPSKAIDGSTSTIWHTSWSSRQELPQAITLTLQEAADGIYQLRYTPRTDKDWNGTILQYKISVSADGENFTDAAAGTWEATKEEKTATFDAVDGVKAVRLTGITTKGNTESDDSKYVSAAEINLVCSPSFVRDSSRLEELVRQGQAITEKGAFLEQVLTEAEEALADNLTVQERYDELAEELTDILETKTSLTGYEGKRMYDTNGERIQAHGGQISKWGDTYYWYGEDKTNGYWTIGVHLYTSKDLYNWEDQGLVMRTMTDIGEIDSDPYFQELYGELSGEERQEIFSHINCGTSVVERPKVLYNEKTGKYVLWFHADGPYGDSTSSYAKAMAGVAVADRPEGPFRLLGASRLHCSEDYSGSEKGMARDMNVFQDDDGTAYILYASEENATLYISKLNEEYTDLSERENAVEGVDFSRNMVDSSREAPAMFKYQGKYYLMTSGCTGWEPNAAIYYTADSPLGPWQAMGNPCVGAESDTTFRTQSTCIFPVDAANGKFVYMGDRWNSSDLADSRYVWLPVDLGYDDTMSISAVSDWKLEELNEAAPLQWYKENTVYFVDCSSAEGAFHRGFAERGIELLNQTADQKYDGTWGLVNEPGTYNGKDLFGSGYWAKTDEPIVYRFTLPAGSFTVYAGFREWWPSGSPTRYAALNVKKVTEPDTEQEETQALAEPVAMNTTKEDQSRVFETAFVMEEAGMVEIRVDKVSGADPTLAWLGITGDVKQPEPSADDTALQAALDSAKEKDLSSYTEESAAAFREALARAEQVLAKAEASQEEIDAALEALRGAENGLEKASNGTEIPVVEPKPQPTDNAKAVPTVGKTYDVKGMLRYRVTKSAAENGTVTVVKLLKKDRTKAVIPSTVELDGYTFKVTAISANAFKNCKKLKSVTIGANVTSIGKRAFYKCTKLKKVLFKGTKAPKIGVQAFKGIQKKYKLTVPKKMTKKQRNMLQKRMKKAK